MLKHLCPLSKSLSHPRQSLIDSAQLFDYLALVLSSHSAIQMLCSDLEVEREVANILFRLG